MLAGSLKRNTFFALSVCFLLLFVLWIPSLFSLAEIPSGETYQQMQAHSLWMGLLPPGTKIWTYIAFILTFISAASLLVLNNRHLFHPANEFLLPLLYVLFSSAIPATQWFSGIQAVVLLNFLGLHFLFASHQRLSGLAELFIASFCFSLASLCFPPALLLLLLLPVAIIILRTFAWRDWVISFFGALTPYAYLLFYYWMDARDIAIAREAFLTLLPQGLPDAPFGNIPLFVFFAGTAFLLFLSLTHTLTKSSANKIKILHIRAIFRWMLLLIIAGIIFYPSCSYQAMPLLAMPVTVIAANYLAQPGRKKMKIFCWLLLWATVIYLHVAEFL
ncbi:MAG: DUF6427 family protein [Prevotellaceae bacterium]|jgi:hypothetical protein|nr:DUF6427 family protein [Prevotellaceae bacterium]